MAQSFMPPLPLFTLESLVALGQWSAAQTGVRRKTHLRRDIRVEKENQRPRREKPVRNDA